MRSSTSWCGSTIDWGFFNPEGLWVSINLFEAPEGDDAAPPDLLVTYTFTDGW